MATVSVDTLLSALSYAASETLTIISGATLTVDASNGTFPGTITCVTSGRLLLSNASTTTPIVLTLNLNTHDLIFEQNGILMGRGAPISLGTATGAASETFSLAGAPLNVIPYPSHFEAETAAGSGEYVEYKVVCTAGKTVTYPTTDFSNANESGRVIFWDATARTLTAGNGTLGSTLPAGANVRIPNIYVHCNTNNATPNARSSLDLNPAGTFDCEWVAFSDSMYVQCTTFQKFIARHCGFVGFLDLGSANLAGEGLVLDHVSVSPDTQQTTVGTIFRAINCNGPVALSNVCLYMGGQVTAGNPIRVGACPGLTKLDDCEFGRVPGIDQSADECAELFSLPKDFRVNRMRAIGGRLEMTNCADVTFVDFRHSFAHRAGNLTTAAGDAILFTNCQRINFLGFSRVGGSTVRNGLTGTDAQSLDITVYNADFDCGDNTAQMQPSASGSNIRFINCTLRNLRGASIFVDNNGSFTSVGCQAINCRASLASGTTLQNEAGQDYIYDLCPGTPNDFSTSLPAAGNFAFANLIGLGLTPTTGHVVCGPFGPGDTLTLSGGALLNQAGQAQFPVSGASMEVESQFVMHGITSFQNALPTWTYVTGGVTQTDNTTPPTGLTAEFRIRNPGGAYGAYATLDGTNLAAAIAALSGYDSDVGLYMQCRFTASVTDATLELRQVYVATNVDNTYQAPDGSIDLHGPAVDDETTLYRVSDDAVIATFTGGGVHEFFGAAANFGEQVYLIRRNAGGQVLCTLETTPFELTIGDNGEQQLFFGAEVQLAHSSSIDEILALVTERLDANVSGVPLAFLSETYEGAETVQTHLRITRAALAGKTSGGGTAQETFYGLNGTTPRIVSDNDGKDRTSVTVSGA